jgi:lysozyme family protein
MVVAPAHQAACDRAARAILAYKNQYVAVSKETSVPWFVIGMIDMMEAGGGCRRHLHNGDSLLHRTVNVPRGRLPAPAQPPFTWPQSAKDALAIDGLDKVKAWSVELLCYELEKYNGFGYRAHGINSPYLWSYSNEYHAGKFVSDGVYSPNRRQRTGWRDANLQVALHTRQDNQLRWQARGARRAGSRAARTNSRRLGERRRGICFFVRQVG